MKLNIYFSSLFLLLNLNVSYGQNSPETIPMSSLNWDVSERAKHTFEEFDGRETLLLNGKVILKGHQFSNGIIEVDVHANEVRSFAGIIFRKQGGTMEETYMRLHKSKQPDAVQYSAIYNQETNWQLYREHQANVTFKTKGWNTLRVEVNGTVAKIFVNNEKVLTVNDLKTGYSVGQIGLTALFNNRFSNFRVTKMDEVALPNQLAKDSGSPGIIKKWNVTQAFPYIEGALDLKHLSKMASKPLNTEASGLLPISKYIERTSVGNYEANKEEYAVVSTVIVADTNEEVRQFFFDYSDKIFVYLNGALIFSGNNAFRSKGVQYQGHMDINANSLYLVLKNGKNSLHCVVIDKANGWGIIGGLKKAKQPKRG